MLKSRPLGAEALSVVREERHLALERDSFHDDVRRIAVRRARGEELLQIQRALNLK